MNPASFSTGKYQPAYPGARFDKSGYCLKHPMIRLCEPTTSGGEMSSLLCHPDEYEMIQQALYKIVRKVCPMCGEHSLRNVRKLTVQRTAHGYTPRPPPQRGVVSAGTSQSTGTSRRRLSTGNRESSPSQSPRAAAPDLDSHCPLPPFRTVSVAKVRSLSDNLNRSSFRSTNGTRGSTFSRHDASILSVAGSERRCRSTSRSRTAYDDRRSSRSVGPKSSTRSNRSVASGCSEISRRHSIEMDCVGSIRSTRYSAEMTSGRRSSAPDICSSAKMIYNHRSSLDTSSSRASTNRHANKKNFQQSKSSSTPPKSYVTPSEDHKEMPSRGRIESKCKSSQQPRGRSQSKSRRDSSTSLETLSSRGRSISKSRNEKDSSIISAGRSFTRSLTRRRSLSRGASKVLETTSDMDGGKDAEPCTQRYEVPFNPTTGRCNYHPDVTLALRSGGLRGGWRIVCDSCPKCGQGGVC